MHSPLSLVRSLYLVAVLVVAALIGISSARPMDVFAPPVTQPNNSTIWRVGGRYNVTWDTSHPPKQITNQNGRVVLLQNGQLDYEHPLAQNFSIMAGRVEITVPKVTKPDTYQIVLFGDSGNVSPRFTITK